MQASIAQVTTDTPQRLITRLCKHWGHKFPVQFDDRQGQIELSIGHCRLNALENALQVNLQAEDEQQLQQLQTVVAEHLQRMAATPLGEFVWSPAD